MHSFQPMVNKEVATWPMPVDWVFTLTAAIPVFFVVDVH
jgi:hypothetical protein